MLICLIPGDVKHNLLVYISAKIPYVYLLFFPLQLKCNIDLKKNKNYYITLVNVSSGP